MATKDLKSGGTQLLKVDARAPAASAIRAAADAIRGGGLVAFPTETVYGLGAQIWSPAAVGRIFTAKGRPANDPLIVHIAEYHQLREVAREIPPLAQALCQRFWPGPLTIILKKQPALPAALTAGLDTVALRMPSHAVALALLRAAGLPIAAPSANRFSRPSPTTAQHVRDDLGGAVDIILDGGATSIGVESTIVSLAEGAPALLRPGGIPLEALRQVAPGLRYQPRYIAGDGAAPAPGTMLRHYSPRARVLLFQGQERAAVLAAMRAEIARHGSVGVLAAAEDMPAFADTGAEIFPLGASEAQAAQRLFAGLRRLDQQGVELIIARAPAQRGLGLALWDRLLRAAVGAVIEV